VVNFRVRGFPASARIGRRWQAIEPLAYLEHGRRREGVRQEKGEDHGQHAHSQGRRYHPGQSVDGIRSTPLAGGRWAIFARPLLLQKPAYSPARVDASPRWVISVSNVVTRTSENPDDMKIRQSAFFF
jgi:hypothetical protein